MPRNRKNKTQNVTFATIKKIDDHEDQEEFKPFAEKELLHCDTDEYIGTLQMLTNEDEDELMFKIYVDGSTVAKAEDNLIVCFAAVTSLCDKLYKIPMPLTWFMYDNRLRNNLQEVIKNTQELVIVAMNGKCTNYKFGIGTYIKNF